MKTVLCLSTCLLVGQAHAAGYFRGGASVEDLGPALAVTHPVDNPTFAKGYVAGIADATAGASWCPASRTGDEQIHQAVARYVKDHPEFRNRGPATIVGAALATDFPCSKKGVAPL